jgi:hypothetical protein
MKILDKVFREKDIQGRVETTKAATKNEYTSLFHGSDIYSIWFFPGRAITNIGGHEVLSGGAGQTLQESVSRRE